MGENVGFGKRDLATTGNNADDESPLQKEDPEYPPDFSVMIEPSGHVRFVQFRLIPQDEAITGPMPAVDQDQAQVQEEDGTGSALVGVQQPQVFKCFTPGCTQEFPDKRLQVEHGLRCEMKRYPCTFPGCTRRFKNSKQRNKHLGAFHRPAKFICGVPGCTASFKVAQKLEAHEARCRFKYETLQQLATEEGGDDNDNDSHHLDGSQNPETEGKCQKFIGDLLKIYD